ncbi:MAG: hypothetical protein M1832_004797 [Thelocarpon impressellum]|nr:MAG: hypothetical protein M1832_004797 [Thelocarpon impressellum]
MNPTTLRRLATERRSLHSSPLPPNYLFPAPTSTTSDDLTQLTLLLAGPQGTPYAQGMWRLQLRFPEDYPRSPPKAAFRTRIWHPNVDEASGSVCVDTLKRDWREELMVRDVLITISCLLIHPNPDSALNSSAGQLLQEDYETFSRQAKLMTSIHAVVPRDLRDAVVEAKRRGDEGASIREDADTTTKDATRITPASSSLVMKSSLQEMTGDLDEEEDDEDESKENDPSLSPSPVTYAPPSPRKNVLGKRPLSALPTPIDPDAPLVEGDEAEIEGDESLSPSERNIARNTPSTCSDGPRKSPKLSERGAGVNASGRVREDTDNDAAASLEEVPGPGEIKARGADGKENVSEGSSGERQQLSALSSAAASIPGGKKGLGTTMPTTKTVDVAGRKAPAAKAGGPAGGSIGKAKARVGLRRL